MIKEQENSMMKILNFFLHLTKTHTHPSIQGIFKRTLHYPLPKSFELSISPLESNQLIVQAAKEQDEIGWTNFFKGHISDKWAKIQLQHYGKMHKNPPCLSHWSKNIIIYIYNISYSMWIHRNQIVHEDYEDKLNKQEEIQLQCHITNEYNTGPSRTLQQHRYMFMESIDDLLKRTVFALKNVNQCKVLHKQSI